MSSNTERATQALLALLLCLASIQDSRAADTVTASLLACAKLAESERLSCYDQLAARVSAQQSRNPASAPPPVAADPTIPRQPPGVPEPQTEAEFGLPRPVPQAVSSSITARITGVHVVPQRGVTIELDNGQRWQQFGKADLDLAIGDTVNISRGALGSFWLRAPSNRGAKVTRLH